MFELGPNECKDEFHYYPFAVKLDVMEVIYQWVI